MLTYMSALFTVSVLFASDAVAKVRMNRSLRGLTFIEYALLGAIVVTFAVVFRGNIKTALSGVVNRLTGELSKT